MNNILIIDYFSLVKRYYRLDEDQDKNDFIITFIDKILPRVIDAMVHYKPSITIVASDMGKNVRALSINSDYKANRKKSSSFKSKVELLKVELLKIFIKTLPVLFIENKNTEADTIIYCLVNYFKNILKLENTKYIIGSSDSDFIQLLDDDVVIHNWNKPNFLITNKNFSNYYNGLEGFYWPDSYAFAKSFTGDISDNIKGVGGFGWKTVTKLFNIIGPINSISDLEKKVTEQLETTNNKSNLTLLKRVQKNILKNDSKFNLLLNNQKIIDFSMLEIPYLVDINNKIKEQLNTGVSFDQTNFKKIVSINHLMSNTNDDYIIKKNFLKEIMLLKQISLKSNNFLMSFSLDNNEESEEMD